MAPADLQTVEQIDARITVSAPLNTRDGSVRPLVDIKRSMLYRVTSFTYDPKSGTAFYTNDNRGYLAFRDLMSVNVKTGETRMLMENGRIGEIVFNPADESLFGVRHEGGLATLVRLPKPYDRWYRINTFPYGVVPYDLDVSADGRHLRTCGAGDGVGEIALLRSVPRTATVIARTAVSGFAIDAPTFLASVSGPACAAAAEAVAASRLGELQVADPAR